MLSTCGTSQRRIADEDEQLVRLQTAETVCEHQKVDENVSGGDPGAVEDAAHIAVVDVADPRYLAVAQAGSFVSLAQPV